jgi:hypothetical protein
MNGSNKEPHWLDGVVDILTADATDLRELMVIGKGRPETFFVGFDLRKLDLRGMDLSGLNFRAARIDTTTKIDEHTRYDEAFTDIFAKAFDMGGLFRNLDTKPQVSKPKPPTP